MSREQFANAPQISAPSTAWTTLSAGIDSSVTSLSVVSASHFPSSAQYRIAIENELLLVTAGAGTTTWTVTRGVEGTIAASHSSGASVFHVLTAAALLNSPGPLTTTGDVAYLNSSGAPTRLAAGTDGQYLRYLSGLPTANAIQLGDLPSGIGLTANPLSQFAATTSAQLAGVLSDETGSGAVVFATSPTLVTPILGTPTSGTLTNCTLPVGGVTGLGSGVATFLATPSSANLGSALTDKTGSGVNVFATSPTLVTPVLGVASATSIAPLVFTGANTLEQYNSTTAQTLNVYNTRTDASNYERLAIKWSSNTGVIGFEAAGSGSARAVELRDQQGNTQFQIGNAGGSAPSSILLGKYSISSASNSTRVEIGGSFSQNATSGTWADVLLDGGAHPTSTSTLVFSSLKLAPTINYSAGTPGGGSYEACKIAVTETALPTGTNYLIRASAGAAGTTDKFTVTNAGDTFHAGNIGFYGTAATAKQTVTGSRSGNAALASLLTALATIGLVTDSSSA